MFSESAGKSAGQAVLNLAASSNKSKWVFCFELS